MKLNFRKGRKGKKKKTARQKTDRSILCLVYLVVFLFLCLIGYMGYFLVIPREHIASVSGVNAGNSAVVAHIFEVIAKVTAELGIESYRVVSNIGEQAGQSVPHLHFHVLAGRDMTWPPG